MTPENQNQPEQIHVDADFRKKFFQEDQRMMGDRSWNYKDRNALNAMKDALEAVDDSALSSEQLDIKDSALWLWYHHAAQDAFSRHGEKDIALQFINKALTFRSKNNITPLLKMLFTGELPEARAFAESLPHDNQEKSTALALVEHFEKQGGITHGSERP